MECWFPGIADKRIRRSVFRGVKELIAAMEDDIEKHNNNPQSFTGTAKAEAIP